MYAVLYVNTSYKAETINKRRLLIARVNSWVFAEGLPCAGITWEQRGDAAAVSALQ